MKQVTTVSVLGNECERVAGELLKQPDLLAGVFEESNGKILPESQQITGEAKKYTGERSTSDDQRLLMVGALRCLGASDREIERACGVTRRSIGVMMEALEKSGRVTPLKERLTRLVGVNAEQSSIVLRKLLDKADAGACDIDLAAMVKSVGQVNSFLVEKLQLLTGQATEIRGTVTGGGRAEFEAWLRDSAIPVESESTAQQAKPNESAGNDAVTHDVTSDTTTTTPTPDHPTTTTDGPKQSPGGGSGAVGGGGVPTV